MNALTPEIVWTTILAAASAFVLLSNAVEKIVKAVKTARAPNQKQDERIADLEAWKKTVEGRLSKEDSRLDIVEESNRATHRALLALLDHSIDGNNIKQMQDAKEELTNHLINR